MKLKIKIVILFLFISCTSFAQLKDYNYEQELKNVKDTWHTIIFPDDIFEKVSPEFSDIRIFGVTKTDTIEAPYILQIAKDDILNKNIDFKLINQSNDKKGYYYTFQLDNDVLINQINLDFKNSDFDYSVNLEASNNQDTWFSILNNYRVLAIKNSLTDYQFTKLSFTNAKYKYFRLFIPSNKNPELKSAKLILSEIKLGEQKRYQPQSVKINQDKKNKQTIISIELPLAVPISKVKIIANNQFDYYRPISINQVIDSVNTPKGWIYNYQNLSTATLNSIDKNEFILSNNIIKIMNIIIENGDNQILKIQGVELNGFVYKLIARFNEPATYFLAYGNKKANMPDYDIKKFSDKIPSNLNPLSLGEEKSNKKEIKKGEPLFNNKLWLWIIMGFIIILLGWFTLKMMRNQ